MCTGETLPFCLLGRRALGDGQHDGGPRDQRHRAGHGPAALGMHQHALRLGLGPLHQPRALPGRARRRAPDWVAQQPGRRACACRAGAIHQVSVFLCIKIRAYLRIYLPSYPSIHIYLLIYTNIFSARACRAGAIHQVSVFLYMCVYIYISSYPSRRIYLLIYINRFSARACRAGAVHQVIRLSTYKHMCIYVPSYLATHLYVYIFWYIQTNLALVLVALVLYTRYPSFYIYIYVCKFTYLAT